MRLNGRTGNIIIIVVASVLVVGMLALVAVYSVNAMIKDARSREMLALAAPLENERRELEIELENMERMLSEPIPSGATLTLSLLDLNEEMYSLVFPMFIDAGDFEKPDELTGKHSMTGTLCLSPEELPDSGGNMTRDQFDEMISAGFGTAVFVSQQRASSQASLDSYLLSFRKMLAELSIDMPEVAYFSVGTYSSELHDQTLLEYGIETVIHEENEGDELIGQDLESEIWRIGAVGWSGAHGSSVDWFNSLLTSNGGLSFGITIHYGAREAATHFVPGDSETSFRSMLGTFGASVQTGDLHVDGAAEGRENYEEYLELHELAMKDFEPERQRLVGRIREIDAELDRIYSEYRK